MGFEENAARAVTEPFFRVYQDAVQDKLMRDAKSHNKAVWLLADYSIPADTRQMARSWGMEEVMMEMWRNAFIAGWRAAHKEIK